MPHSLVDNFCEQVLNLLNVRRLNLLEAGFNFQGAWYLVLAAYSLIFDGLPEAALASS